MHLSQHHLHKHRKLLRLVVKGQMMSVRCSAAGRCVMCLRMPAHACMLAGLGAGAMDAGRPAAGIRISREAGTTVRSASYLPAESAVFCRFLSSRKVTPEPLYLQLPAHHR